MTGAVYGNSAWRREQEQRQLFAEFYELGPIALPEMPGDENYGRRHIAFFLAVWASEGHVQVDEEGPPLFRALLDVLAADIFLLVSNVPLDERSVAVPLPEPNALRAAIREVPPGGDDTRNRHEWRLGLRTRVLRKGTQQMRATTGSASERASAEKFDVEVEQEIAAGYCGRPTCAFCELPPSLLETDAATPDLRDG